MTRRVVVAGCWDEGPGYPRADSLIQALLALGHEVEECRVAPPLLRGPKSELVSRPWRWPGWWLAARRSRRRLRTAFRAALARGPVDAVVVPYPGQVAAGWVRSCYHGPVVLDLFLSAYGTAVDDRGLFRAGSLPARALAAIDRRACSAADLVLMDTPEHAEAVCESTGLPAHRFDWVPISDVAEVIPAPFPEAVPGGPLRVVFFGTGVPLHGLETWVRAIQRAPGVHLELFGGDQPNRTLASRTLGARLILRPPFVPMSEIRAAIDRSQVVAGIFGTSDKAGRVIPFKVVHAMAHGRAVVTADTPVVRRLLQPGVDCLVSPPGCVEALAALLCELVEDPTRLAAIGVAGRARFERSFSSSAVASRLGAVLSSRLGFCAPASAPGPSRADLVPATP